MWSWVRAPRWVLSPKAVRARARARTRACARTAAQAGNRTRAAKPHRISRRSLTRPPTPGPQDRRKSGFENARRERPLVASWILGVRQEFRFPCRVWFARHSNMARLAQSAERKALNLVVVGSSPTVGAISRGCARARVRARARAPAQAGNRTRAAKPHRISRRSLSRPPTPTPQDRRKSGFANARRDRSGPAGRSHGRLSQGDGSTARPRPAARTSRPCPRRQGGRRAALGIEPGTSRARSENHTTRPSSRCEVSAAHCAFFRAACTGVPVPRRCIHGRMPWPL